MYHINKLNIMEFKMQLNIVRSKKLTVNADSREEAMYKAQATLDKCTTLKGMTPTRILLR